LRRADHVVTVSESIAAEAEWLGVTCPISVIGHFAEPIGDAQALDGPGPHLVHTGQFSLSHPERTLDVVLDAFQRALLSFPTATLHLVGRLTHGEIEVATRHPSHDHIKLYGPLPYTDARAFQRSADGLVLYQPDTAALPGKISEYLLCDAPILTVGRGEWQDRVKHIPHWPLEQLATALAAGRRVPVDLLNDALDRYERVLLEPGVARRGGPI
jgi:glycosyltransferase involved in cell wall biosynthesis